MRRARPAGAVRSPEQPPGPGQAPLVLALAGVAMLLGVLAALEAAGPAGVSVEDGLSWLGANRATALPFVFGGTATVVLLLAGARLLAPLPALAWTRLVLRAGAVLLAGVLLTPYTVSAWVHAVHNACGAGLFSVQLAWVAWLWRRLRSAAVAVVWLAMLATGLVAFASLLDLVPAMLWAQLAYQALFLGVLPFAVRRLVGEALAVPTSEQAARAVGETTSPGSPGRSAARPAGAGPASTGPASTGPASTGPASTGPTGPTGTAADGPASPGQPPS